MNILVSTTFDNIVGLELRPFNKAQLCIYENNYRNMVREATLNNSFLDFCLDGDNDESLFE